MARLAAFEAVELDGSVAAHGRTRLYTHGQQTDRVIVLVHGITNCPEQYVKLAPAFHARGFTVFVPRMPHHGLADRSSPALGALTAAQLCEYADTIVDIARGLGRHVTVAGISAGGVIAAWLAQHRADIDLPVQIVSAFRTHRVRVALNNLGMGLATRLPNVQLAIDGALAHGYTAHSTRGFGEVMKLGEAVRRMALDHAPAARSALVITNANDDVDNGLTYELLQHWQRNGMHNTASYEFAKELGLSHDIIDPAQHDQQNDYVYPILIDLIDQMSTL